MNRIRLTYLATTALCLALIAVGFLVGVKPQLDAASAAASQRDVIAQQNATLELRLAELARARDEIDVHKADLAALREAMPADGDYEAYLDELAELADAAGVMLTTTTFSDAVAYGAAVPVDPATDPGAAPADPEAAPVDPDAVPAEPSADPAAPPAAPAVPATGPVAGSLYAIPVQVGVRGPGPSVQAFLDGAQHSDRFALVTRVSLSAEGDVGDVASGDTAAILDGYVWALPE